MLHILYVFVNPSYAVKREREREVIEEAKLFLTATTAHTIVSHPRYVFKTRTGRNSCKLQTRADVILEVLILVPGIFDSHTSSFPFFYDHVITKDSACVPLHDRIQAPSRNDNVAVSTGTAVRVAGKKHTRA